VVGAIHGRVDRCARKLLLAGQLVPRSKLLVERYSVGLGKTLAALIIRLGHGHDARLARMSRRVGAVCMKAAVAGPDYHQVDRLQRPMIRTNKTIMPINTNPINKVSRVIANSGVPGRKPTSNPPASNTTKIAQRNA